MTQLFKLPFYKGTFLDEQGSTITKTGTNPATDTTVVSTKYFSIDFDVGDRITNIVHKRGVE